MAANQCAQPRVGAVDFVASHPRCRDLGLHSTVDQRCGQRRFGRENLLLSRDSSAGAARRVASPRLGQVQGAVDQGVSTRGGVGQIHRYLGVLDTARGAAVLTLHPDTVDALLHIPGSSTTKIAPGSPSASMT